MQAFALSTFSLSIYISLSLSARVRVCVFEASNAYFFSDLITQLNIHQCNAPIVYKSWRIFTVLRTSYASGTSGLMGRLVRPVVCIPCEAKLLSEESGSLLLLRVAAQKKTWKHDKQMSN